MQLRGHCIAIRRCTFLSCWRLGYRQKFIEDSSVGASTTAILVSASETACLTPIHSGDGTSNKPNPQAEHGDDLSVLRERAASVLEKAGINPEAVMVPTSVAGSMMGVVGGSMERVNYCNILLPLPQPLVPDSSPVTQRLFIVCQPSAISERVLRDAFSRFGNLIDVFLLTGRNYGYAKYATKESAMKAIQTLHGQNLAGQRVKVLEAEPPKGGDTVDTGSAPKQ